MCGGVAAIHVKIKPSKIRNKWRIKRLDSGPKQHRTCERINVLNSSVAYGLKRTLLKRVRHTNGVSVCGQGSERGLLNGVRTASLRLLMGDGTSHSLHAHCTSVRAMRQRNIVLKPDKYSYTDCSLRTPKFNPSFGSANELEMLLNVKPAFV